MNIIWFNGPSAADFYHINSGFEIGCNFISDRRRVQHVCVYDGEVMSRLKIKDDVQYWTRKNFTTDVFKLVDTNTKYSCSGTMAVQLALNLELKDVYLLGCDWTHTDRSVFDNLYGWRTTLPKKVNNVRLKIIENIAPEINLIHVTDRPPIFAGVNIMSSRAFLDITC
jgi:hypothetical protein